MTLYIFIALFIASNIVWLFVNYSLNKKNGILTKAVETEIIKLKQRTGFYDGSYNLGDNPKTCKYTYRVYVTELEKYTNGYSKIRYDGCTVSGHNADNYKLITYYVEKDFLQVTETNTITFLEKDKDITQVRKDKLERILNETK